MPRPWLLAAFFPMAGAIAGCAIDEAPSGLRATPAGDGATVVFDLTRRPLPEIPAPNDVATFADPTSRTGRRINVSLSASTRLERVARDGFDAMEGWGTFAPITVAFTPGLASPGGAPALDLNDLRARMQGDGWSFADDPIYVVNLRTGVPVALDLGSGSFSATVVDPARYWVNDTRASGQNLLFETAEEGPGLTQAQYRPALDTDFDGVLDHPNTLGAPPAGGVPGVDDLLTWYERETDTLVLRPMVPMDEKTEYAVVLTDRLRGSDGKPVRSPFPFVHHPEQKESVARLAAVLGDASRAAYYGDVAGTGLAHVAFAWTFTTQPVAEDLRLLRDGLYGRGPFARVGSAFPAEATAMRAIGLARDTADDVGGWQSDPRCAGPAKHPYILKMSDARDTIHQLLTQIFGLKGPSAAELESSIVDHVDHIVVGSFRAPYYLGDPEHEDPDARFRLDFTTGDGDVNADTVQFWVAVPRATATAHQPFPAVMWSHGTAQSAAEVITRAGYFARSGLAMVGINMPGHGLVLTTGQELVAEAFLRTTCMTPWVSAITQGRARDLDGDGVPDPGGLLWTAHIFHSRDNVRQSVLDQLAATRVVRAWDGHRGAQDFDGDGTPEISGDFDADGVVDVGGPSVPLYSAGDSYGGIVAMIHGAVDPFVTATAPISGAGALIDVATRSQLVPDSVMEQVLSPLVVGVPATDRAPVQGGAVASNGAQTACARAERSVRFVVNDLVKSAEIEIACLSQAELDAGKTVVVSNASTGEVRCGRTWQDGRFRIAVPTSVGDRIDVQIYDAPDVVDSYKGCRVRDGAPAGRRISTWEKALTAARQVADETKTCDAVDLGAGCQQFRSAFYAVGSPLVAPNEGLGLIRQSPDVRRLMNLTQAAIDPGDPVNFAPYYALKAMPDLDGVPLPPRAVLASDTVGDPLVPVEGGAAFARAAGALPFLAPSALAKYPEYAEYVTPQALYDAWGGRTANEALAGGFAIESLARMGRTHGGPACKANYVASAECTAAPSDPKTCSETLFDADWLAEGEDLYDAPHPPVPLRLARKAGVRVTGAASLDDAWAPRLRGGGPWAPSATDANAWAADEPVVGLVNAYVNATGQHVFVFGDPCKAFDDAVYYDHLVGRFLASGGKDVYFLSHPASHRCMATQTCPFLQ